MDNLLKQDQYTFDEVVSVNFIHHAKNPAKCLKEMVRVAKNKLIIADLNKRGEHIMEKVHSLDGHSHQASKMPLVRAKELLKKLGLSVRTYNGSCQIVLVANKYLALSDRPVFASEKGAVK